MKKCNCKTHPHNSQHSILLRTPQDFSYPNRNTFVEHQNPDGSRYLNPKQNGTGQFCRSVFGHFARSVSASSIAGFSRVSSAKNWCQRLAWALVLVSCLSGFGYQAFEFLSLYCVKPSVVQIEVEKESVVQFPAVSFCNNNRLRKSEFCDYLPQRCSGPFLNISISGDEYSDVIFNLLLDGKSEVKYQFGHLPEDMLQDCTFNGYPEVSIEECRQMLEYFYDPGYGNCFTFPSKNLKGQILKAREADFWQMANELSLFVDVEADELLEEMKVPGVILTVHDGAITPDMETDGKLITPGSTQVALVKKSTIYLLPHPFKTNCTEFKELPWQKNFKKQLNPRICTVRCSQYFQKMNCAFITKNLSLFYEVLPYDPKKITEADRICAKNEEKKTQDYCKSICGLPCRDTAFDVSMHRRDLTQRRMNYHRLSDNNRTWNDKMKNLALIKIRFSTLEHKIFRHVPKYDTMELFSYLGGYSGVWLGFSLLTVYEMVEIVLSTARFALQKYMRTGQYKKVLRATRHRAKGHGTHNTKRHFK